MLCKVPQDFNGAEIFLPSTEHKVEETGEKKPWEEEEKDLPRNLVKV